MFTVVLQSGHPFGVYVTGCFAITVNFSGASDVHNQIILRDGGILMSDKSGIPHKFLAFNHATPQTFDTNLNFTRRKSNDYRD